MTLTFQEAIERLVIDLKLPFEYHRVLCQSFELENDHEELIRYVQGSPISFHTLPLSIKNKLADYIADIQQVVETDIYEKAQDNPSGFGDENGRDSIYSSSISVRSMVFSPILSSSDTKQLQKVSCLRLLVNDTSLIKKSFSSQDTPWTLSLEPVKELLELLGTTDEWKSKAMIDGHEPARNLDKICQLAGHLLLYGWNSFVTSQGILFQTENEAKAIFKALARSGVCGLALKISAQTLDAVGFDIIKLFCQYCKKNSLKLTICYIVDDHPRSKQWLQNLLADCDFNEICPTLQVLSNEKKDSDPIFSRIEVARPLTNLKELIVGPRDQLEFLQLEQGPRLKCSFHEKHWKEIILRWLDEPKEENHA